MTRRSSRLIGAYVADGLLEWATSIALLVWAYDRTGSALAAGALLVAKQATPGLLTPVAGRLLDRRGPAVPLALGLLLRGAATAAILLLADPYALLPLAAVAGTGGMFVRASLRTHVATSFTGDERRAANAATNTAMGITSLVGPAVGGVAVAATSASVVGLSAAAAGALAGAGVLATTAFASRSASPGVADASGEPDGTPAVGEPFGASAAPGEPAPLPLAAAPRHLAILGCVAVIAALLAMDEPALLPYATDSLGGTARDYGVTLGAWGAGIIVGSLWLARLRDRSMLAVAAWGAVLVAGAYLGLAAAPSTEIAVVIAIAGGIGNGLDWTALVTALQERTPEHAQGRLAADLEAVLAIGPPIGFLIGGVIADAAGPRAPFVVGGAFVLLLLAAGLANGWRVAQRSTTAAHPHPRTDRPDARRADAPPVRLSPTPEAT